MPLPRFPLQDQLRGFSRALFATWLYHRRFNLLFDAGEGVATTLLNRVFGIRNIFLSHGHADHIAGLVNLINIRNLGAGDQTADLTIYYPRQNALIETLRGYLSQTQSDLSFALHWVPIEVGQAIPLDDRKGKTFLRTFRTQHSQRQLSLGFNIIEIRRRLKPEFQGQPQSLINEAIWERGKESVAEGFEQIMFSYAGDSRPINPVDVEGSLFLCHECTYLRVDDDERNFQQHSVLDAVLEVAEKARVKNLMLFHVSLRYSFEELRQAIHAEVRRRGFLAKVLVLFGDRLFDPMEPLSRRSFGARQKPGTNQVEELEIEELRTDEHDNTTHSHR